MRWVRLLLLLVLRDFLRAQITLALYAGRETAWPFIKEQYKCDLDEFSIC